MKAVKGGPKTIQHPKAVNESTQDKINSLYFLDKVLKTEEYVFMKSILL